MSKIGKLPIEVKDTMTVSVTGQEVRVSGPKGEYTYMVPSPIQVIYGEGKMVVSQKNPDDSTSRALFGLTRATLANMVKGVVDGFTKQLELTGVGYRAQLQGTDLVLNLGFSHPVKFTPEPGITFSVAENVISVSGSDKALVGNTAAQIRKVRPPEPYKGKGIKYVGEYIRRKAGKAAKAVGTK
jgi:large subunit ribosomal protein L6